jgi:hypothetical protein
MNAHDANLRKFGDRKAAIFLKLFLALPSSLAAATTVTKGFSGQGGMGRRQHGRSGAAARVLRLATQNSAQFR